MAVTNTPDVLTEATAELALALTLAAARRMSDAERGPARRRLARLGSPAAYRGIEIAGSTVGVVGLGRIGHRYARLAHGLGAKIAYAGHLPSRRRRASSAPACSSSTSCSRASDVVSLHAPAIPETRGLIGARELELIGSGRRAGQHLAGSTRRYRGRRSGARERDARRGRLDVYDGEPHVPAGIAQRAALRPASAHRLGHGRPPATGWHGAAADNVIAVLEGADPPSRVILAGGSRFAGLA